MSRLIGPLLASVLGATALGACVDRSTPATLTLETDEQKIVYAVGLSLAKGVADLQLSPEELEVLLAGFRDAALDKPSRVDPGAWSQQVREFKQVRVLAAQQETSRAYLEQALGEEGAVRTESGLVIRELMPGEGESPVAESTVKVHYHGKLIDGKVFDSSVLRGSPATFPLNRVIPCWTEGVQRMRVGGKSELVCPADIAYGQRGFPPHIKPGATLIFEVELLEIVKK